MDSQIYTIFDVPALAARIRAAGGPQIDPSETTGEAEADGVTLRWSVSGNQITVTIVHHPWIISESTIWSHIAKVMHG